MSLRLKPTIRSRAPLLNSTGVFDLRNSDCESTCMAPMSLTARSSGLNRPRGILRPLQSERAGAVQRFATSTPSPADAQSAAGARPHDPHLPRATRPQRERCGRLVSAQHRERMPRAARRAQREPPFAADAFVARATRDARTRPRVNQTSPPYGSPARVGTLALETFWKRASRGALALLSLESHRLAQQAVLRRARRGASLLVPPRPPVCTRAERFGPRGDRPARNTRCPGAGDGRAQ